MKYINYIISSHKFFMKQSQYYILGKPSYWYKKSAWENWWSGIDRSNVKYRPFGEDYEANLKKYLNFKLYFTVAYIKFMYHSIKDSFIKR